MLSHIIQGSGETIVFLHGFCENKHLWDYQLDGLKNDFHLISFDLPAFGESPITVSRGEFSIEYMAKSVKNSLDKLGVEQCVLIGHSLGGYVALAFAEMFPKYLLGLGMFHSTAFADSELKKSNRDKTMDFIKRNGVDLFAKSFVQPLFSKKRKGEFEEEIKQCQKIVRNTTLESILWTTEAMKARPDRSTVLKSLTIPVIYIIGEDDLAVPLEQSKKQVNLASKTKAYFLKNVAHMGMYEEKELTKQLIKSFCNTVFNKKGQL